MRRVKKSVVVVIMMLFSIILFSMTNVHAANKKLKVNKVYTTTKKILFYIKWIDIHLINLILLCYS